MAVESVAYFKQRVLALGLAEHYDVMVAQGWSTMGSFAFAANHIPGNSDESSFIAEVVTPVLGMDSHPLKSALRRLFLDSYTAMAADAQRKA
eukprot:7038576-Karenia_brevis.AAC.1